MKRVIVLVMVLALLLPVLTVSAFASSSYTFYLQEGVLYSDGAVSDFYPESSDYQIFIYHGVLPEGKYKISFSFSLADKTIYAESSEFFNLDYDVGLKSEYGELFYEGELPFDFYNDDGLAFSEILEYTFVLAEGISGLILPYADIFSQETIHSVQFELAEDNDIGLSAFIDSVVSGFLDFNTVNLTYVLLAGVSVSVVLVIGWFGYRFIKRKVKNAFFKAKL